jgi:hypothetical protein
MRIQYAHTTCGSQIQPAEVLKIGKAVTISERVLNDIVFDRGQPRDSGEKFCVQ